jgi:hypothetical protein
LPFVRNEQRAVLEIPKHMAACHAVNATSEVNQKKGPAVGRVQKFFIVGLEKHRSDSVTNVLRGHHRHTLPVTLGCADCSFQFGLTSILLFRLPHLAQTTRLLK